MRNMKRSVIFFAVILSVLLLCTPIVSEVLAAQGEEVLRFEIKAFETIGNTVFSNDEILAQLTPFVWYE